MYADRVYRDQLLGTDRIRCYYRWEPPPEDGDNGYSSSEVSTSEITYKFPLLGLDAFYFNLDIAWTSQYCGTNPGSFNPDGIPFDIFSDINVRLGFAYAFDYTKWLTDYYLNEGEQPSDPVIKGLPYDNPAQEKYSFDVTTRTPYYLMLAWGGVDSRSGIPGVPVIPEDPAQVTPGALWNNGMKFGIVYPVGNTVLGQAACLLATNINNLNPKFHVYYIDAMYGVIFLPAMVSGELPLFLTGWRGDFPDPHNFVYPFMHSQGYFADSQCYYNPTADSLIKAGISTPEGPARQQIYYDLQALYHNDVPSVPIIQPVGRQFERDWMRGWYYNPIHQGQYVYHWWKAKTHFGDVNNDGAVGGLDWGAISAHWYNYAPQADLTGGVGGTPDGKVGPVRGIPDGKIMMDDLALVSAYWDVPPGPSHP